MDNGLIAKRYATALYKMAVEKGNATHIYEEMKQVAASFRTNPDLQPTLANPYIPVNEKEKLLQTAAGDLCDDDYRAFIRLIIQNKREEYARDMALAYNDIYRSHNKISQVKVITAQKLPAQSIDRIHQMVTTAFPDRKLEFTDAIDQSLIAGFVIYVDNVKMDASISNELEKLRQNLLSSN